MTQFDLFSDVQNKVLETKNYSAFKKALAESNCTKCTLSQSRTHIVVDRGNPEASVLFIGEAPGENEDIQGRAFVGRAGQLLDKMLLEFGFETNRDSIIINVVKCRPPANRAPKQEEADACRPYLQKQISLLNVKVVLLLGATALKHIVKEKNTQSMAERVGTFFEHPDFPGAKLMILFHPAYILRDPRKKPLMMEHLGRFIKYWKEDPKN